MTPDQVRRPRLACLPRAIAVANGKGGTGKTSTIANQAGLAAAGGYRVLCIDADPQGDGNLGSDLGYNAAGLSDRGLSLARALAFGGQVDILKGVRQNLDVICGGEELETAMPVLTSWSPDKYRYRLLELLQDIAPNYDLIFIDTPPGNKIMQEMVFTTVKYFYISTRTDTASIDEGVGHIAKRYFTVKQESNPDLTLLGVVICATTYRGEQEKEKEGEKVVVPPTARFRAVVERLETLLGGTAPVYQTHIRYVEAVATDSRDGGQLAHELEQTIAEGPSWAERLRDPSLRRQNLPSQRSTSGLADDYQQLTAETLGYVLAHEEAAQG